MVYLFFTLFPGDENKIEFRRKRFYSNFLKAGDIYFDVGANEGNRILPILNMGIKIIAIEPQAELINNLKEKFGNHITIVPKGLGATEDKKIMHISVDHVFSSFSKKWISSTKESGRLAKIEWNEKREIEMTTLDNLIDQYGVPNFVKIDVEGYELDVLKGLSKPIDLLSFEYVFPEQKWNAIKCLEQINKSTNGQVLCNYSVGESLIWGLKEWCNPNEMISYIENGKFISFGFGDIYVKHNGNAN